MKRAAMNVTLHFGLIFGIAINRCLAQKKSLSAQQADSPTARVENPELLSFEDLVTLASTDKPECALAMRYGALLNTPFVHGEITAADISPHRPSVAGLGTVLRVGLWNRAMRELNNSVNDRISDHPPMTVDLPLTEPAKIMADHRP